MSSSEVHFQGALKYMFEFGYGSKFNAAMSHWMSETTKLYHDIWLQVVSSLIDTGALEPLVMPPRSWVLYPFLELHLASSVKTVKMLSDDGAFNYNGIGTRNYFRTKKYEECLRDISQKAMGMENFFIFQTGKNDSKLTDKEFISIQWCTQIASFYVGREQSLKVGIRSTDFYDYSSLLCQSIVIRAVTLNGQIMFESMQNEADKAMSKFLSSLDVY